jgi:hypothetical protein
MLTAADLLQVKKDLGHASSEEHAKTIDRNPAPNGSAIVFIYYWLLI